MRALICGGRNFGRAGRQVPSRDSRSVIKRASEERMMLLGVLDRLHQKQPLSLIICGDEGGAERLGLAWAQNKGVPVEIFSRQAREDIVRRNNRMLREGKPDRVLSFAAGETTIALLAEARRLGIEVESHEYADETG